MVAHVTQLLQITSGLLLAVTDSDPCIFGLYEEVVYGILTFMDKFIVFSFLISPV